MIEDRSEEKTITVLGTILIIMIIAFFMAIVGVINYYSKMQYAITEYKKANETVSYYIKENKELKNQNELLTEENNQIFDINSELNYQLGNFQKRF